MPKETNDKRHADQMGLAEQQVNQIRNHFNESLEGNVMRHILNDRLERLIKIDLEKLEKCKPEDLTHLQGRIEALRESVVSVKAKEQPL